MSTLLHLSARQAIDAAEVYNGRRPLDELIELAQAERTIAELMRGAVRDAREKGETWQAIGNAACVSRQAAWERWAR